MRKIKTFFLIASFYNKLLENDANDKKAKLYSYIYLTSIVVFYVCWNVYYNLFGNINYNIIIRFLFMIVPFIDIFFNFIHMPHWLNEGYKEKQLYFLPIETNTFFFIKFFKDILFKLALLSALIIPLLFMNITILEVTNIFLLGSTTVIFLDTICAILFILSIRFINLLIFRTLVIGIPIGLIFSRELVYQPLELLLEGSYILYFINAISLIILSRVTQRYYKFCVLMNYEKKVYSKLNFAYLFSKAPYLTLEIVDIIRNFSYYAIIICRLLLIEIILFYKIHHISFLASQNSFLLVSFIITINALNYYPVTCISKDKNFKHLLSKPVPMKKILDIKILISFIISMALIICFFCFLYKNIDWNFDVILLSIVYTYLLSYIGVQLDYHKPNFDYDNIDQLIRANKNRINLIFISIYFYFILMVLDKYFSLYTISVYILLLIFLIRKKGVKL